ncbi:MAG: arsenic transporter, partial [Candidatus Omnitrophica bacterium]|nr:arsenic transporter [Candidatus Omnitrophota bacterium]
MEPKFFSLTVFVLAYLLFIALPYKRAHVAVAAAALLLIFRVISFREAFFAVNWNVMGIFVGTLALADAFMASRVPAYIAEVIVDKA